MLTAKQLSYAVALPAFLFAGTFFAFSETVSPEATPAEQPNESVASEEDGIPLTYSRLVVGKDGKVRYEDAHISFGDISIRADEVIYDTKLEIAHAHGTVAINLENLRFLTDDVVFARESGTIESDNVRGGIHPFYFSAEAISGSSAESSDVTLSEAVMYFGEPHWSSLSFCVDSMHYNSKEDWLHLSPSVLRIAGVPVLPLPPISVPRLERPPVRIWANSGSSSTPGLYLRTTTRLTLWDNYEPGMLLDFYERSGPLVGPALAYDTRKESNGDHWMFGDFQSGYINDTAKRENDIYGNSIGGKRGFIDWFHKQQIDRLEITGVIHRWSDSQVVRNFRPDTYDENRHPDNFFEFVVPDRGYYLSALTRMHLNDFQSTQQRLPEIRLDMMPREIAQSGIYQRFSASYAYLVEENSDEYHLVQTNDGNKLKSSRADVYYGLDAPIKFGDVATLTPVAGIRTTFYGDTVPNAEDTYWRTIGQVGFDLQFLATGVSDYTNETWKINGLRHVFRPVFQYRYLPGVDSQSSRIPQIDRDIYRDAPSILDLGENRAVDQIYDEHIFRIGLENLFQTRHPDYGSTNLAEFNIYQDIRKTERPVDDRRLSDNFMDLTISPAPWVSFLFTHRMDVYSFNTKSLKTGVRFTDGDVWSTTLAAHYLSNDDLAYYGCQTHARQYTLTLDYRLNSYWDFYGNWRYDDEKNIFTDQYYGLRQRFGNSWLIEYYVRYRRDAGDDSDFSIGVSLSLVTF